VEGLRTRFAGGKDLRGGPGRCQEEKDSSLTKNALAYANGRDPRPGGKEGENSRIKTFRASIKHYY